MNCKNCKYSLGVPETKTKLRCSYNWAKGYELGNVKRLPTFNTVKSNDGFPYEYDGSDVKTCEAYEGQEADEDLVTEPATTWTRILAALI